MNPSNINQSEFNQHCFEIARLFPNKSNNHLESNQVPAAILGRLTHIKDWLCDIYDYAPASEEDGFPTYEDFVAACLKRCDPEWSIPCAQPQTEEEWDQLNSQIGDFRDKIKAAFDIWGFEIVYKIDKTSAEFAEDAVDALDSFVSKHKATLQALPFDLRHDLLAALFTPGDLSNMQALTTRPSILFGSTTWKQEHVASLWARRHLQTIKNGKPIRAVRTVTPAFDAAINAYLDSLGQPENTDEQELKFSGKRAMSRA